MTTTSKNTPRQKSVVADSLHKPSGSAVSEAELYNRQLDPQEPREWFIAIVEHQKYTVSCSQYIEKVFKEQGCICFVPSKQEERRYANRTRRMVTKFIIPRYIFVSGISERQAYDFVRNWPHVDMFMADRAMGRVTGRVRLAKISHREMLKFQQAIREVPSSDDILFTTENLVFDEQIEVVRGGLKGLEGGYFQDSGDDFLVFMLGKLGNIKVRVSRKDCRLKK